MTLNIRIDVHHHFAHDEPKLDAITRGIAALLTKGNRMTQEVEDLKQAVADVKAAVGQFPAAVDAFEARITALIQNSGMSQADKDELAAATKSLKDTLATATAALADAADGTDEAATAGASTGNTP